MEPNDLLGMFAFALGLPIVLYVLHLWLEHSGKGQDAGDIDEGQSFGGEYHD